MGGVLQNSDSDMYVAASPGVAKPRYRRVGIQRLGSGFKSLEIFVRNLDRIRSHEFQSHGWLGSMEIETFTSDSSIYFLRQFKLLILDFHDQSRTSQ